MSGGTGFGGWGTISDPVTCQGTIIAATSGSINLTDGLMLSGTGQVNLGSGALTVNDSASGMTGGSLAAGALIVGSSGTGTFTQSGGTNSAGAIILGEAPGSMGTYNFNGGLLSLAELLQGSGSAAFNLSRGTIQAASGFSSNVPIVLSTSGSNGTFDTNGNTLTLSDTLSGPGGLNKAGAGMLTLAGSMAYTGATIVSGGTLALLADMPTSSFTVNNGGTLLFSGATASPKRENASFCLPPAWATSPCCPPPLMSRGLRPYGMRLGTYRSWPPENPIQSTTCIGHVGLAN